MSLPISQARRWDVSQVEDACPTPTLPAQEIEDFVVNEIRKLAKDPELAKQVFAEASRQQKKLVPKLEAERKRLLKDKQAKGDEIRRSKIPVRGLLDAAGTNGRSAAFGVRPKVPFWGLAELEGVVCRIEGRAGEIDGELKSLRQNTIDPEDVAQKLAEFDGVWVVMHPAERVTLINALIHKVVCHPEGGIRFVFGSGADAFK